jgi:RNA polymerase sigma-70 factor (ECF subfamily)
VIAQVIAAHAFSSAMSVSSETHEHSENDQQTQGFGSASPDSLMRDPLLNDAINEASRKQYTQRPTAGTDRSEHPSHEGQFIENPDSDEALFRLYQQGSQTAFLKIYERFKSNIYAYCARALYTAGMDAMHVDDCFQEVFLRVTQYQHTFIGGDFRAWIFTVTRHTCLISKRKFVQHVMRTERVGDAENFDEDVRADVRTAFSVTDDPLERMSRKEQTDLLLKAIESLPETYREALLLSDYEGLTYEEIGKMTGTSLSTIRIRIFRAKARLRKVLLPIIGDEAYGLVPDVESQE